MSDMNEPLEEKKYPVKQSAAFASSTAVTMGLIDAFGHLGPTGLLVGGIVSYVAWKHGPELYEQVRGLLPLPAQTEQSEPAEKSPPRRSFIDRALGRYPQGHLAPKETDDTTVVSAEAREAADLQPEEDTAFAHTAGQTDVPGVPRLTIEQIVSHSKRNSYEVYIGRSMTRMSNPAVRINFYKRHLKLLGASQHGKSSMAAALLEIILRTHDPQHVQLVLLDHEDKASRLFANAPHLAKVRIDEQVVRLHARSEEQVLEHLEYLSALIDYRYTHLSEEELEQQPLVIVYLEEFIDLKDSFKHRIDTVEKHEKEQAKRDYARLIFCMKKIARRGLKVLVQLLMCAQVDYRDEDLQEALVNVTSGMSFCLRVTAAQAAGFYQTELLQRNAKEDKIGQAVAEMPDCKDLILAPAYDLRARLQALEKAERQDATRDIPKDTRPSPLPEIQSEQPMVPTEVAPDELPASASLLEKATRQPLQFPQEVRRGHTAGMASELRAALEVYQPGMNYRDLGKAGNYSDAEARLLWQELKQRGLLHATGNEPAQDTTRANESRGVPESANIRVLPVRPEHKPHPALHEAIVCWNELIAAGQHPSRQNLQQALIAKGFDCKEYWARKFIEDIQEISKGQQDESAGG